MDTGIGPISIGILLFMTFVVPFVIILMDDRATRGK